MKTLAVIKNELFKDYVKIVSTENLQNTLDNPEVPVPYTCVSFFNNSNSDALVSELGNYFGESKITNKEFFLLSAEQNHQLNFILHLLKISSGETTSVVENQQEHLASSVIRMPLARDIEEKKIPTTHKTVDTTPVEVLKEIISEATIVDDLEDPFIIKITPKAVVKPEIIPESTPEIVPEVTPEVAPPATTPEVTPDSSPQVEQPSDELIQPFNIPKNSVLQFFKKDTVTATLIDENTVDFEGNSLSLSEAAKLAFKKAGGFGMANGLNNWMYNGQTLQQLINQV